MLLTALGMLDRAVLLHVTIRHYTSLYVTICYYMLLYVTICHYIYICHYMLLYIYVTIRHYMSLYVTICYYIYIYILLTALGMLDRAVKLDQCFKVTVKVALYFGSSKLGKAFRESVGWNLVVASQLGRKMSNHHFNQCSFIYLFILKIRFSQFLYIDKYALRSKILHVCCTMH